MKPYLVRERLLTNALVIAKASQISAEAGTHIHIGIGARVSPIGLQTMSDIDD